MLRFFNFFPNIGDFRVLFFKFNLQYVVFNILEQEYGQKKKNWIPFH